MVVKFEKDRIVILLIQVTIIVAVFVLGNYHVLSCRLIVR